MNLRIDPDTRQPIEQAAAALGKTRTEFIVDTAKRAAIDMNQSTPREERLNGVNPSCNALRPSPTGSKIAARTPSKRVCIDLAQNTRPPDECSK